MRQIKDDALVEVHTRKGLNTIKKVYTFSEMPESLQKLARENAEYSKDFSGLPLFKGVDYYFLRLIVKEEK